MPGAQRLHRIEPWHAEDLELVVLGEDIVCEGQCIHGQHHYSVIVR
jgi:hypothetical protein